MGIKKFLIIFVVLILTLFLFIGWLGWKGYQLQKGGISIVTDKTEYEAGGNLKVKIKNNFGKQICFSSCYPYLLESKNEKWESYKYTECQKFNGNGHCIETRGLKAYELTLPQVLAGLHRLVIPVCLGCKDNDLFREDKRFYSNEFLIKEKKVEETTNWKTYMNEEQGFEFKYPKDWGDITFKSQEDEVYTFESQNEKIEVILYHKSSGIIVLVEKGEKYKLAYGGEDYQDILKVIDQNKKIKTLYTVSPEDVKFYGKIGKINISPNGKYISFIFSAYEYSKPLMINIEIGQNIFEGVSIWFDNPKESIYWSLNNEVLAIKSEINEFSGEGICGVFVSDYGNPDKLNEVFSNPQEKHFQGMHVSKVQFIDNENLFFEIGKEIEKYIYNSKTKELKKTQ